MTIKVADRQFSHIEALIFDKDGTLVNSANFWREMGIKRARLIDAQIPGVAEPLLMAFGIQDDYLDPTGLMAVGSRYENEIAAAAYIAETGRAWLDSLTLAQNCFREADHFLSHRQELSPLFSGVFEALNDFSLSGLKIGVVSADITANVRSFIREYHLSDFVDFGLGSDHDGFIKPDPRLYLQVCENLGVAPENTLMIGDAESDIIMAQLAKAAGAISISWGKSIKFKAATAIATLKELIVARESLSKDSLPQQ